VGDFRMILGAVKVSDDLYGDFAAVLGIRRTLERL